MGSLSAEGADLEVQVILDEFPDHVPAPEEVLKSCRELLRHGIDGETLVVWLRDALMEHFMFTKGKGDPLLRDKTQEDIDLGYWKDKELTAKKLLSLIENNPLDVCLRELSPQHGGVLATPEARKRIKEERERFVAKGERAFQAALRKYLNAAIAGRERCEREIQHPLDAYQPRRKKDSKRVKPVMIKRNGLVMALLTCLRSNAGMKGRQAQRWGAQFLNNLGIRRVKSAGNDLKHAPIPGKTGLWTEKHIGSIETEWFDRADALRADDGHYWSPVRMVKFLLPGFGLEE